MISMLYKMYEQGEDLLLAVCDKELLGKKFKEGDLCLDVKESFYGGEEIDSNGLLEKMEGCTIANLVGQESVGTVVEAGFGREDDVIMVDNVPHLQIVRLYIR